MGTLSKPLIETVTYTKFIMEAKSDGRFVARGEFGRVDTPTLNNRVYPKKHFMPALESLNDKFQKKQVYGELDHPDDGKTKLTRASHIITSLNVQDDGVVMGEAEILPTPNGKILRALIEAGCEVGVSSRGRGSVTRNKEGHDVVGEDFQLVTYDFVAEPAMSSALPQFTMESINEEFSHEDLESLKKSYPDLYEQVEQQIKLNLVESKESKEAIQQAVDKAMAVKEKEVRESLKGEFAKKLQSSMVEVREDAEAGIRKMLMEDPQVGGSMAILTQIASMVKTFEGRNVDDIAKADAIAHYSTENEKLKEENKQLIAYLQESVNHARLEQEISGHPHADEIREAVGDVSKLSKEELIDKIEFFAKSFGKFTVEDDYRVETKTVVDDSEIRSLRSEVETLRSQIALKEKQSKEIKEEHNNLRNEFNKMVDKYNKQIDELSGLDSIVEKYELVIAHPNAKDLFESIRDLEDEREITETLKEELAKMVPRRNAKSRGYTKKMNEEIGSDDSDDYAFDSGSKAKVNEFRMLAGL